MVWYKLEVFLMVKVGLFVLGVFQCGGLLEFIVFFVFSTSTILNSDYLCKNYNSHIVIFPHLLLSQIQVFVLVSAVSSMLYI